MPGATWKGPVPNQSGAMSGVRGVVVHIMDGTLAGTNSWFHNEAAEASSHFGTGKGGALYQWVDAGTKAWAQADGNTTWLSVENEGRGGDQLTDAQLDRCAEILAWAHREWGVPLQVATSPSGRGLGHHGMGGSAWGGHTSCPGPRIVAQKVEIVRRAKLIVSGDAPAAPSLSWTEKLVKDLKTLGIGDDGYDAKTVRGLINARGYYNGAPENLKAWLDSLDFDEDLAAAVKRIQHAEGLDDDGIVGPKTWPVLLRIA